jgi:hypothetical protein
MEKQGGQQNSPAAEQAPAPAASRAEKTKDKNNESTEKRIDAIGWSLFFILIGGLLLMPENYIYEGIGLIILGLIIFGVQLAKYIKKIKTSLIMIVLGLLSITFGIIAMFSIDLPVFSIALIVIGIGIFINTILNKGREYQEE